MKLVIFTIVLDGQPFIERHLPIFEKLKIDWEWRIAEGASANTHCTKWCTPQMPRFSRDGTTEYLTRISKHPKVKIFRRQLWDGKISMCNACVAGITEPCVLLQVDVDEIWTADQLERIVKMFEERPEAMRAFFFCRYWIGKNIIAKGENCYSNRVGEWLRAFRFTPGMTFSQHEPPVLAGNKGLCIMREETRTMHMVFEHHSWDDENNVRNKLKFYGYGENSIEGWKRLQNHTQFPTKLKPFLPWVDDIVEADLIR